MNEKSFRFEADADLLASADVVVCGGGTSGVFAAVAAAREGKSTVLIERFGALGGTPVQGLVLPTMSTKVKQNGVLRDPQNSYLSAELDLLCEEAGIGFRRGSQRYFDPLLLGVLLEKMAAEAGVKVLLYTSLLSVIRENDRVSAVIVSDKEGIHAVEGKVFVDATGDGDLSVIAGADYSSGDPRTGKNQPMSLRYLVGGVDIPAFASAVSDGSIRLFPDGGCYASCVKQDGTNGVERILSAAREAGDLKKEDLAYWQIFSLPNRKGTIACNCPEFFERIDGTKAADLTNAQLEGKRAVMRQLAFYKKYFRGFENAYVSDIAAMVGVRESREIVTDYVLTLSDVASYHKFEDAVAQSNYSVDVHGFGDAYSDRPATLAASEQPWFEIPYRSLTVRGIDNLLVAGRAIGCDFFAEAAARIIPTCRATGEAAGIAAAVASERGIPVRSVNGSEVRKKMIALGADFLESM
ncbi:MAG: FAD-dependent oxidoreductase [Lachnospiraceae bacterium]|nr:FAD-dependent oxidoreductase [Lachnospiraceae bacterium]